MFHSFSVPTVSIKGVVCCSGTFNVVVRFVELHENKYFNFPISTLQECLKQLEAHLKQSDRKYQIEVKKEPF